MRNLSLCIIEITAIIHNSRQRDLFVKYFLSIKCFSIHHNPKPQKQNHLKEVKLTLYIWLNQCQTHKVAQRFWCWNARLLGKACFLISSASKWNITSLNELLTYCLSFPNDLQHQIYNILFSFICHLTPNSVSFSSAFAFLVLICARRHIFWLGQRYANHQPNFVDTTGRLVPLQF